MQSIKYNTNYNISFKLTDNGEKCLDLHIEHPEEIIDIVKNIIIAKKHADAYEYPEYITKQTLETLAKYLNIDYNTVT